MLSSKGQMVSLQLAALVRAVNDFTKSSFSIILERAEKKLLSVLDSVVSGFHPGASWTLQGSWGGAGTQAWLGAHTVGAQEMLVA